MASVTSASVGSIIPQIHGQPKRISSNESRILNHPSQTKTNNTNQCSQQESSRQRPNLQQLTQMPASSATALSSIASGSELNRLAQDATALPIFSENDAENVNDDDPDIIDERNSCATSISDWECADGAAGATMNGSATSLTSGGGATSTIANASSFPFSNSEYSSSFSDAATTSSTSSVYRELLRGANANGGTVPLHTSGGTLVAKGNYMDLFATTGNEDDQHQCQYHRGKDEQSSKNGSKNGRKLFPRRRHSLTQSNCDSGNHSVLSASSSSTAYFSLSQHGHGHKSTMNGSFTDGSSLHESAVKSPAPFSITNGEKGTAPQHHDPNTRPQHAQQQSSQGWIAPAKELQREMTEGRKQDFSGDEECKTDKSILNLLVSIQAPNDGPFQDSNDSPPAHPTEVYPQSDTRTNNLEFVQRSDGNSNNKQRKSQATGKPGFFKSVAARLFAARNDYYSSPSSPQSAAPAAPSLFLEPNSNWQQILQDSIPNNFQIPTKAKEEENHLAPGGTYSAKNSVTESSSRQRNEVVLLPTTPTIQELIQSYHTLAHRLKILVDRVRFYQQANQELKDARAQFLKDCDGLCRVVDKEASLHFKVHDGRHTRSITNDHSSVAEYEIDRTWRSRARIRQWIARISHPQNEKTDTKENGAISSPIEQSPRLRQEDAVLQAQEVLHYVTEWEDIVAADVGQQLQILEQLEDEKNHYARKIQKLQHLISWTPFGNLSNPPPSSAIDASTFPQVDQGKSGWCQAKLERNLHKLSTASQTYDAKEEEVAFLLQQVTRYGWKDLYPPLEALMHDEWKRFQEEQDGSFRECLAPTISEVERVFEEEASKKEKDRKDGPLCPMAVPVILDVGENMDSMMHCPCHSQISLNRSKPLLVLDETSPHGTIAWITMLENETDPYRPTLCDLQLVAHNDAGASARGLKEKYRLEEDTPLLVHKGIILFGSMSLAEYLVQFWKERPPYRALHEPVSLIPSHPVEEYNMNEFLNRHSSIEEIWNEALMFWLKWHYDEHSCSKISMSVTYREERKELQFAVQRFIMNVEETDLAQFAGPFLCGHRFTLADIHLFAYWERIVLLLLMMKMLDQKVGTPPKLDEVNYHDWVYNDSNFIRLSTWYKTVSARPSALAMQQASKARFLPTSMRGVKGQQVAKESKHDGKSRKEPLLKDFNLPQEGIQAPSAETKQ